MVIKLLFFNFNTRLLIITQSPIFNPVHHLSNKKLIFNKPFYFLIQCHQTIIRLSKTRTFTFKQKLNWIILSQFYVLLLPSLFKIRLTFIAKHI